MWSFLRTSVLCFLIFLLTVFLLSCQEAPVYDTEHTTCQETTRTI